MQHPQQNDYGITSTTPSSTTTRRQMKSPQPTPTLSLKAMDQVKHLRRKYEQVKQALSEKKDENAKLEERLRQMQELYVKRQREIEKKDSIHDALLYQIRSLNGRKGQQQQQQLKTQSSLKSVSIQHSKSSLSSRAVIGSSKSPSSHQQNPSLTNTTNNRNYQSSSSAAFENNNNSSQNGSSRWKTNEVHFSTASEDQSKEEGERVGGYFGMVFQ